MILLIIKTYQNLFLSVAASSLLMFLTGLYFILKTKPVNKQSKKLSIQVVPEKSVSNKDLSAIAGDDVITTQLDLARAYIETGALKLAKTILDSAIEQGNNLQQNEARMLLTILNKQSSPDINNLTDEQVCNETANISRSSSRG